MYTDMESVVCGPKNYARQKLIIPKHAKHGKYTMGRPGKRPRPMGPFIILFGPFIKLSKK
jgi:hypothetical protein